jgi:hypothetical protein
MRTRMRDALFWLSDRLCAPAVPYAPGPRPPLSLWRRCSFEIGHRAGELGWRFR